MQLCQASPPEKPCMILGVFYSDFCRVSLAEYLLVLRVYLPPVAGDQFYFGCCKYCLLPAGDED